MRSEMWCMELNKLLIAHVVERFLEQRLTRKELNVVIKLITHVADFSSFHHKFAFHGQIQALNVVCGFLKVDNKSFISKFPRTVPASDVCAYANRFTKFYHRNAFAIIIRKVIRRDSCAIIVNNEMKLRPKISFSREPFKKKFPMGNFLTHSSNSDRHDVHLNSHHIFLFLNSSREKWFNERISPTTTTQRRFKCFPKLIQTTNNKQSETSRSVSNGVES